MKCVLCSWREAEFNVEKVKKLGQKEIFNVCKTCLTSLFSEETNCTLIIGRADVKK